MADPTGIGVAFTNGALATSPTWTRLDDPEVGGIRVASSWSIARGRGSELDKTDTGTASIDIIDQLGLTDPTNTTSPLYGYLDPYKQAAICLWNPIADTWHQIYRGFVDEWLFAMDERGKTVQATLELMDALGYISGCEMTPGKFGETTMPADIIADVYYAGGERLVNDVSDPQPGLSDYDQGRINQILDDMGWPAAWREVFSGNVSLQPATYNRGDSVLQAILDCADAEFPGVANLFASKEGNVVFHGRYARFNPEDVQYHIARWRVGDVTTVLSDDRFAPFSTYDFRRSSSDLINSVMSLPAGVPEEVVPDQLVEDTASITEFGRRSHNIDGLLLKHGQETPMRTAVDEAHLFADYYVSNQKSPRTRMSTIKFRPHGAGSPYNPDKLWDLLCNIEINDIIELNTTHQGGGGFSEDFFVERISYECTPGQRDPVTGEQALPDLTLEVEVSPRAWFTSGTIYDERPGA